MWYWRSSFFHLVAAAFNFFCCRCGRSSFFGCGSFCSRSFVSNWSWRSSFVGGFSVCGSISNRSGWSSFFRCSSSFAGDDATRNQSFAWSQVETFAALHDGTFHHRSNFATAARSCFDDRSWSRCATARCWSRCSFAARSGSWFAARCWGWLTARCGSRLAARLRSTAVFGFQFGQQSAAALVSLQTAEQAA